MNPTSRFLTTASLLCIFLLPLFSAAGEQKARIGVIAPLSGTLATSGLAFRNAIVLADEMYDRHNQVEFLFEDDGFFAKNSVAIARKFIAEKVDAILILGTPTAYAVVPVTEQAQMPLAAGTIVDKVVADRQFAVRHFVAWQKENRKVIEEVKRRGYDKIAIVTTVNDATISLRDGFARQAGVEIVLNEEFSRDDMDFRAIATKIKSLKPDAVYNLLFAPQGSAFMKTLRSIGCEVPVFAVHNAEDPSEILAANGAYEGVWLVTGDDRAGSWVADAYVKRFKDSPAMGWSNGFDLAKMTIEAVSRNQDILTAWKNLTDFEGVFGRYGSASGNSFDIGAIVKVIRDGRITTAQVP